MARRPLRQALRMKTSDEETERESETRVDVFSPSSKCNHTAFRSSVARARPALAQHARESAERLQYGRTPKLFITSHDSRQQARLTAYRATSTQIEVPIAPAGCTLHGHTHIYRIAGRFGPHELDSLLIFSTMLSSHTSMATWDRNGARDLPRD